MLRWDHNNINDLYLFSTEEIRKLPDGTILTCINGKTHTKGKDKLDLYSGNGCSSYGVRDPWNHPLKDLFLIFKLSE